MPPIRTRIFPNWGAAQLAAIDEPAVADERVPQVDESADWLTRTALCAEAREGRLYLFMPPWSVWRITCNWSA
ncbi:hypothetical protein PBOI14_07360 [Pseudomonas sp. Boi14]|nr:hypothetical protein PBOI14_07360 [Pseudomonas sp. Boi14]